MWQSLGDLIPNSIQKAGIGKQVSDAMVCAEFDKLARGSLGEVAESCHAVYIKNNELWVAVLSSAVSSELKMYEQDILKALAAKFGQSRVRSIRFMV